MRTHSGERPFKCDFDGCGKAFAQSNELTQHVRTHTGDRPYTCPVAGCNHSPNSFVTSGHLMRHLKRHHNPEYVAFKKEKEEGYARAAVDSGWTEYYGGDTLPPPGSFKREHRIDFECAAATTGDAMPPPRTKAERKKVSRKDRLVEPKKSCRIDFIFNVGNGIYVFLEMDEFQHRFGYMQGDGAAISCDAKRVANVHTSLTLELGDGAPKVFWLRFNPDAWHVDGELVRGIAKPERYARALRYIGPPPTDGESVHTRWADGVAPVTLAYAFYDSSAEFGLDVLDADEFPAAFRDCVIDVRDLRGD